MVDEKVTLRTEEFPCPITGVPHLRTVEVVEKVIETEVRDYQFSSIIFIGRVDLDFVFSAAVFIFLSTEALNIKREKQNCYGFCYTLFCI